MKPYLVKLFHRNLEDTAFKRAIKINTVNIAAGGVGYNAILQQIRYGFSAEGTMYIIEPDIVQIHNLNRQNFKADLGKYKCDALKKDALAINPYANIVLYRKNVMFPSFASVLSRILAPKNTICFNFAGDRDPTFRVSDLCYKNGVPNIIGGASPSLPSFYYATIVPGKTCCARCIHHYFLKGDPNIPDKGKGCRISLISTMTALAAKMMYEGIRYLAAKHDEYPVKFHDMDSDTTHKLIVNPIIDCPICGTGVSK